MKYLFYIAIFLSCFTYFRIQEINFLYSDLIFVILFLYLIFKFKYKIFIKSKLLKIFIYTGALLFFFGFLISSFSTAPDRFWTVFSQYLYGVLIIPFVIINLVKGNLDRINRILLIYTLGVVALGVIGILMYYFYQDYSLKFSAGSERRMGSFMENPNELASCLCIAFVILIYLKNKHYIKLVSFLIYEAIIFYSLLLTGSFNGLLTFLVSVFVYLFLLGGKKIAIYLVLATLLVTSLIEFNLVPATLSERIESKTSTSGGYGSYSIRMELNMAALHVIEDHPFIGIGLSNFQKYTGYFYDVHNGFLLVWVEGGVLSFIGLLMYFSSTFWTSFRKFIHNRILRKDFAFTSAILCSIFISLASQTHFYNRYWFIPITCLIILVDNNFGLNREADSFR